MKYINKLFTLVAILAIATCLWHVADTKSAVDTIASAVNHLLNPLAGGGLMLGFAAISPSCLPRTARVSSACGGTLTALNIKGLTPNEFEALSGKEIDLAQVILNATEAKALGVQESGLSMLLRSSITNIKPALNKQTISEQSIILPYIQRRQNNIVNAENFTIEAGAASGLAGTTVGGIAYPASAWNLTVNLGSSWVKNTTGSIEGLERYFLPGSHLYVLTWDSTAAKNAITLDFEVVTAVNADSGGVKKAIVTVRPNVSAAGWAGFSPSDKAPYRATFGVAHIGANSVSDRESWCHNQPSNTTGKLVVNWLQTTRESRCVDGEYQRILDQILKGKVNPYDMGFKWTSIGEQNKQMAMHSENAWLRSTFWGQKIDENQTVEGYQNLPAVADVGDSGVPLEYKANALGIFTMLQECNRVVDFNGNALDLDYIFEQLYYLKRYREADGTKVSVIDSLTDRITAARILEAMTRFYQVKYNITTTQFLKMGEKITHEGLVLFNYNLYDIPEQGVQWAVFWDTFFDDHLASFPSTVNGVNFKSRGRNLWFLDWSDISTGIAGTSSVTRKDPDAATNALYKCVILPNVKTYNLRSTKWTVFVDRPHRHLVIHNFSGDCPTISASACTVPNNS